MRLLGIIQHAPFGTSAIESEVNELAGKLSFVLFELFNVRRQPQGTARRVVWRFAFVLIA